MKMKKPQDRPGWQCSSQTPSGYGLSANTSTIGLRSEIDTSASKQYYAHVEGREYKLCLITSEFLVCRLFHASPIHWLSRASAAGARPWRTGCSILPRQLSYTIYTRRLVAHGKSEVRGRSPEKSVHSPPGVPTGSTKPYVRPCVYQGYSVGLPPVTEARYERTIRRNGPTCTARITPPWTMAATFGPPIPYANVKETYSYNLISYYVAPIHART